MDARRRLWPFITLALIATFQAGCAGSSGGGDGPDDAGPEGSAGRIERLSAATVLHDRAAERAVTDFCRPRDGREVTALPDVEVPALAVPAVRSPRSGRLVLPGARVPGELVDAGCVVRYAAPGGCLGRVEVSPVAVPGLRLAGVQAEGVRVAALELPPETRPGVTAPQVCRQTVEDRELGVTRPGIVREGFSRPGGARPGFGESVEAVRVPALSVPAVDVDPVRLQTRRLPGASSAEVEDTDRTSFVAPARVLFATDSAELRPAAYPELRTIARRIAARAPGEPVLVEGHTDDRGSAAYGLRLSRARAEAVAGWLSREGGIPGRLLRTRGLGESSPVVPNTSPENRQRNRRVVISIPR